MTLQPSPNRRAEGEKLRLGLAYGLLGGLAYSLITWGHDGWLLWRASAEMPWLKLLIGGTFCLLTGGLAGWLSAWADATAFSVIAWLATGAGFAFFASHLPFEVVTAVTGWLDPRFKGLEIYPYPPNVTYRMVYVYIATALLSLIAGALQNYLVESARSATAILGRWLSLGVVVPFFLLAGSVVVESVYQPLRGSFMATDEIIRYTLAHQGETISPQVARDLRLHALDPLLGLLARPRRLILGPYDVNYLDETTVLIDFGGTWARCSAFLDIPTVCQPSDQLYDRSMTCLLQGPEKLSCGVNLSEQAHQWVLQRRAAGESLSQMSVVAQRGFYSLIALTTSSGRSFNCWMRHDPTRPRLEACLPSETLTPVNSPVQP